MDESTSYQHYMNNVFFKYLNDFVQVYLDNVLIYNKIRKKHIEYVRKILKKLINVDFQMNIKNANSMYRRSVF